MSENRSAEDKILAILEKVKTLYELGTKTPDAYVPPFAGKDTRRGIELRFTTGILQMETGITHEELKKILTRLKEDGVIMERGTSQRHGHETIIWVAPDFDEQYKRYRTQLGDKRTERKLEVVADAQERAARDLAIVSGQLDVFASQFSLVAAIHEDIKRNGVAELIARDIEERQKVFQALTRSMTPILDVARDAQRTIEALGIGKSLEQLREPIEQLNVSASEIVKVVDSVQISMYPPVGEVVLPPPKKQKDTPTPALTVSDSSVVFSAQMQELIGIVRKIEQKLPELPQTGTVKISLAGRSIRFDDTKPAIMVDDRSCALPPAKNEDYLARAMFSRPVGEFVDWSIVHRELTGSSEVIGDRTDQKAVRDTMDRLNKRVQEVVGTDDQLLSWENKSIRRNF